MSHPFTALERCPGGKKVEQIIFQFSYRKTIISLIMANGTWKEYFRLLLIRDFKTRKISINLLLMQSAKKCTRN